MSNEPKNINPKDLIGSSKPALSTVPCPVLFEIGAAMSEGQKYGRHNYRVAPIRASIYYDAAMRHLMRWWEGEDMDPDSKLHHLSKAMATLVVCRDAQMSGMIVDDRPPRPPSDWFAEAEKNTTSVLTRIKDLVKAPFTHIKNLFPESL